MRTTINKRDINIFRAGNTVFNGEIVVMITKTAETKDIVFEGVVIHTEDDNNHFLADTDINFEKNDFQQFTGSINFEL